MAKKNCSNTALYESLDFCAGTTVLPGIRQKIYGISKRDIKTWPTLPSVPAANDMKSIAVYSGNFELQADKKWLFISLAPNKGKISSEPQGDVPARTFLNKIEGAVHPETDEMAAAFSRQAVADDMVFLVQQRNGKFRVVGCEAFPTTVSPSMDSGEGVDGDFGTTFEVEATDVCPAPFYPGTIETEDGDISGVDGSPIDNG